MSREEKEEEGERSYRSVTRRLTSTGNGVAALLSSIINTALAYPLDVVKTRFQAQDPVHNSKHLRYTSTYTALQRIVATEGIRGLYRGVGLGMFGAALAWSAYMKIYAHIKDHYESQGLTLTTKHIAVASMTGSVIVLLLTNPIWMVKTRLQLQGTHTPSPTGFIPYRSATDAFVRIAREEGVVAFYKGLLPSLLSGYHGFVQFATYEYVSTRAIRFLGDDRVNSGVAFVAGGVSKVMALITTYPFTVVRTRLQDDRGKTKATQTYKGFTWTVQQMLRNEGIRGFYKGLSPSLMRLALNSALFFLFFEKIKELLMIFPYLVKDS